MARSGETIKNTVTGEVFTWERVAADTDGRLVLGEMVLPPGGFVTAEHVHPNQEERYEVLTGELHVRIDGRERIVGSGDKVVVPVGKPHVWWNAGQDEVRFRCEVTPALHFETFLETLFGLASDWQDGCQGLPRPAPDGGADARVPRRGPAGASVTRDPGPPLRPTRDDRPARGLSVVVPALQSWCGQAS